MSGEIWTGKPDEGDLLEAATRHVAEGSIDQSYIFETERALRNGEITRDQATSQLEARHRETTANLQQHDRGLLGTTLRQEPEEISESDFMERVRRAEQLAASPGKGFEKAKFRVRADKGNAEEDLDLVAMMSDVVSELNGELEGSLTPTQGVSVGPEHVIHASALSSAAMEGLRDDGLENASVFSTDRIAEALEAVFVLEKPGDVQRILANMDFTGNGEELRQFGEMIRQRVKRVTTFGELYAVLTELQYHDDNDQKAEPITGWSILEGMFKGDARSESVMSLIKKMAEEKPETALAA
jgi:hypothetical protein